MTKKSGLTPFYRRFVTKSQLNFLSNRPSLLHNMSSLLIDEILLSAFIQFEYVQYDDVLVLRFLVSKM